MGFDNPFTVAAERVGPVTGIYVEDYNARGDGSTDDAAALNAAATAARNSDHRSVILRSKNGYRVNSQVDFRGLHVFGEGSTIWGAFDGVTVLVGGVDASTSMTKAYISLHTQCYASYRSGRNWETGVVGIRIANLQYSNQLWLGASNYTTGIQVYESEDGSKTAYNTFYCRAVNACKIGWEVQAYVGSSTAWSNQCTVIGGDYSCSVSGATAPVHIISNGATPTDNWTFIGSCFQYSYGNNGPILDNACNCKFLNVRVEPITAGVVVMETKNAAESNEIVISSFSEQTGATSWQPQMKGDSTSTPSNVVKFIGDTPFLCNPNGICDFRDSYNDGTRTYHPGWSNVYLDASYTIPTSWSVSALTANVNVGIDTDTAIGTYLVAAALYGVGFWVQFVNHRAQLDIIANGADYLHFLCFDSSGTLLEYSSQMHCGGSRVAWNAGTKSYRAQYGRSGTYTFYTSGTAAESVKKVFVCAVGSIKRLTVSSPGKIQAWVGNVDEQPLSKFTRRTLAKTGAYSIMAADVGTWFTNLGASGSVTLSLPAGAAGLNYRISRVATQTLLVDPNGAEIIGAGGAGKYLSMDADGTSIEIMWDGTQWQLVAATGTITYQA